MKIRQSIRIGRRTLCDVCMSPIVVRMSELPSSSLRNVRYNLHTTGNHTSWTTTTSRIGRGRRATKAFSQLLHKCAADVVCRNMDCIGNAEYNKRSLGAEREA
jgi:hypothetical protein